MVSSGCPTNTRQTPPKPPAKKFFTGLMGCGCSAMAAAAGEDRVRAAASPPSQCRPLRSATFTPVPGRAARRDTGGGERGAGRDSGGPLPAAVRGRRALSSSGGTGRGGPPASPEGAEPAPWAAPRRRPDRDHLRPPAAVVRLSPPPRPSAVVQSGPAAAPAPPDGSDAARRPVLPACRQWRPGRRSPGRRSLPPPPGRAPRRPVSAGEGRWRWGSWWGGLCRVVPRWRGAGGARRAPPPPAGPASLSGQAAGSRAARRVLGRDESGVRDAVPLLCDFGAV